MFMNIKKYDNKLIRLKDFLGDTYEGECSYYDKDCTEFMYGVPEESLKISSCLFYKSTIGSGVSWSRVNGLPIRPVYNP